ncbi:Phosphoribosylformimino-5-aminoimidazole carboxamide ribotide isomerase [Blyttiomyces helicus]|uniref:1-(5-phosphoribosyl)-5-[(5-phosphoribosylamino)methylideneamino] imidazole-4-carboxamide isomerase n=1 Tax=Blyttiomyces helicus TaxID=388810 RepID=A0A4P9WDG8_9FUNG|nr:Phosphoribosylformimino-5-aminoimidazole carboxamide ribotide isomerase [Blyttiomyces helicus]|eukprot:RKO89765.1 Phosphoribosylformimino-5-aminoimidazole carboxamide ribotide isomerase [Blyttiomyces helicus]
MAWFAYFPGLVCRTDGQVKQIVGASLNTQAPDSLRTNFVASDPPAHFATLYRNIFLHGAHVIKLGPNNGSNNDAAAIEAIAAWWRGLQVGGGIAGENADWWIERGAERVIVTSWLFPHAKFSLDRLKQLEAAVGKDAIVVDVSCKRAEYRWVVSMDTWQTLTEMEVNEESLKILSEYCSEFLVHAADVEGLCQGIDEDLEHKLGEWCTIPCTYAGGCVYFRPRPRLSNGKVDMTFGSALGIFGGTRVKFADAVEWNRIHGGSATFSCLYFQASVFSADVFESMSPFGRCCGGWSGM